MHRSKASMSFRERVRRAFMYPWLRMQTFGLRNDAGQTVAEYALVLLVVAAIALAFLLWARQSGKLDAFFDAIFEKLLDSVDPDATPQP